MSVSNTKRDGIELLADVISRPGVMKRCPELADEIAEYLRTYGDWPAHVARRVRERTQRAETAKGSP